MTISPRMYRTALEWGMGFAAAGAWKFMPGVGGVVCLALLLLFLAAYLYQRYAARPTRWDPILAPLADNLPVHRAFTQAARSKRLVRERELVAAAVERSGAALELADEALRDDKALVLRAIANTPQAFVFASDRLKKDREVVLEAVRRSGALVRDVNDALRDDDEVARAALRSDPQNLRFLSDRLRGDKDFVVNGVAHLYPRLQQLATLPLADAAFFLGFYTDRVPHKLALRQFFPGLDEATLETAESRAAAFRQAVPRISSQYVSQRSAATHHETITALKTEFPEFGEEVYQQAISAEVSAKR
jgi:hypothetical protein